MPRTTATPTTRTRAAGPPDALAKNAANLSAKARAQNEARARELVVLVRDKLRTAASAFYDVGLALAELASPAMYRALGYASFASLVRDELGFSGDKARELIGVAQGLKRGTALALGPARAAAVVELANATPAHDTPEQVAQGEVTVRGHHGPVRPKEMSARAIARAAAVVRRSHRPKPAEASDAEAWVAKLVAKLRKADPHAEARVVTRRRKGEPATAAVTLRVSLAALRRLVGG